MESEQIADSVAADRRHWGTRRGIQNAHYAAARRRAADYDSRRLARGRTQSCDGKR
jgi:hypothetical protein